MSDKKGNLWVTKHPEGWQVKREGSDRASSVHPTQGDAADRAREQAQRDQVEVIIQRPDGRIRSKDSYGYDPNPPKDKEH